MRFVLCSDHVNILTDLFIYVFNRNLVAKFQATFIPLSDHGAGFKSFHCQRKFLCKCI